MATRDIEGLSGFAALDARIRTAVERAARDDPDPSDPLRGLYMSEAQALSLVRGDGTVAPDDRLRRAAHALGLDGLDTVVLALCAAPELDRLYGRLYGYLHDDVTRRLATPRLVAGLLADVEPAPAVLARFGTSSRLRRLGALRPLGGDEVARPAADRLVKVADVVAGALLGADLDARADAAAVWRARPPAVDVGRGETAARIRALAGAARGVTVAAVGGDAVDVVAAARSAPVWVAAAPRHDREGLVEARLRAALDGTWLVLTGLEELEPEGLARVAAVVAAPGAPVVLAARRRDVLSRACEGPLVAVDVPEPSAADRRRAWQAVAGGGDVDAVAATFRLSPARIAQAGMTAWALAAAGGRARPGPEDLEAGARQASSGRLGELAARLVPVEGWERLVLPPRPLALLRSIAAYLRHRDRVLADWGFAGTVGASPGMKALFAGESGTGKTMSAQLLAAELGLELYRIDLATVVSKYIGETEKNLDRVFDAAEDSNAILFFDEADALFGKRSEVGDAHDRYANIEVSYLLQRMEAYPGAVVLASNLRQNIDEAFLRRLDVVVDFPFPEPPERERIWRLVLPSAAPLADDVDLGVLAARFRLSGGGIRNAALAGAFAAAQDGTAIAMRHLVAGVAREYTKLGRLTLESDFGGFGAAPAPPVTGATGLG